MIVFDTVGVVRASTAIWIRYVVPGREAESLRGVTRASKGALVSESAVRSSPFTSVSNTDTCPTTVASRASRTSARVGPTDPSEAHDTIAPDPTTPAASSPPIRASAERIGERRPPFDGKPCICMYHKWECPTHRGGATCCLPGNLPIVNWRASRWLNARVEPRTSQIGAHAEHAQSLNRSSASTFGRQMVETSNSPRDDLETARP